MGIIKMAAVGSAALLMAVLLTALGWYAVFTGPSDLSLYPPSASSPYLLPWPADVTRFCVQGNRAVVSHRGWEEYAYDFTMPVGSDICAARAGTVMTVVVEHDGHGYKWPNNKIGIRHDDGSIGWYLHIKRNGAKVREGDTVAQGQVICESGHVGNSAMPHLHFHVTNADRSKTLPTVFQDVPGDGIPRMLSSYKSGNASVKGAA